MQELDIKNFCSALGGRKMNSSRRNIIVIAYSISPIRGSEYSVGWNYILEMSKTYNLTVFYGLAGDHMGDFEEIAKAHNSVIPAHVEFVPVAPDYLAKIFNWSNRRGFFVYGFYIAYRFWHRELRRKLDLYIASGSYHLIHYLCPTGYREPGYLAGIGLPVVWGPIGGVDNQPLKLAFHLGIKSGIKSFLKTIVNRYQFIYDRRVKRGLKSATVLVSSTPYAQQQLYRYHGLETELITENGILSGEFSRQKLVKFSGNEPLHLIWVGSIDARKALIFLLEALGIIADRQWILHVVGTGPLESSAHAFVERKQLLEKVKFYGKIKRADVLDIFSKSHLHIISSLAEGNPTTLWEAMAAGVPTLSLDHCGMAMTICDKCGIKIALDFPSKVVKDIAEKILFIIDNPEEIERLSRGVASCSRNYDWSVIGARWSKIYTEIMD